MINWSTRSYIAKLDTLLRAQVPGIRVDGFAPQREPAALERGALVEVDVERVETASAGMLGALDGELFAALIVTRRCDSDEAQAELFDLVLEIATVLQDLRDQGTIGPAQVASIDPEPLDDVIGRRAVAWRISYSQQLRVQRTTVPEPVPFEELFAARAPNVGATHQNDYRRLVP